MRTMSLPLPDSVTCDLGPVERGHAEAWWATLREEAQREFLQMWDARSEDTTLYGTVEDGLICWHTLPIELQGTPVDPEDALDEAELKRHLLEYISNHEDIAFFLIERSFHVCRSHPGAREVIRSGLLPASFTCPAGAASCPMRDLLATCPGRSIRFSPRWARSSPST